MLYHYCATIHHDDRETVVDGVVLLNAMKDEKDFVQLKEWLMEKYGYLTGSRRLAPMRVTITSLTSL